MVLPLYAGYGLINPYNSHVAASMMNGAAGIDGLTMGMGMGILGGEGLDGLGGGTGSASNNSSGGDSSGLNSSGSSPMIVNSMGPLAHAAFESGMSAVEELKLLKAQVQDVARVCNAVARGDLSQKITVPVQGVVMVQLKDVINTMVDKLGQFAKEVTRVSQEVGTEGKLGGQALVLDVEGTWRELTGVVNKLAANLTSQVCIPPLLWMI
jgi:methyl-accepting chemotaxis protein